MLSQIVPNSHRFVRTRGLRLVLLGVALVSGARWLLAADELPELPSNPPPGRYRVEFSDQGFVRTAVVQVPRGWDLQARLPVVLTFHGAGGDAAGMLDKNGWGTLCDAKMFFAVAPQGLPALPRMPANFASNPALWNSGQLRGVGPRSRIDDVAMVGRLLDVLAERLAIDPQRVFVTGHSNGAGMTFRLGAELSERLTAIAGVSGQMAVTHPAPSRKLPTLFIYGDQDPLLPEAGGEVKLPWGTHVVPPVAEFLARWAAAIDCQIEPVVTSPGKGLEQRVYTSRTNGPTLTVLRIAGHGHHWPGGQHVLPSRFIGPDAQRLDATEEIWKFFELHGATAQGR